LENLGEGTRFLVMTGCALLLITMIAWLVRRIGSGPRTHPGWKAIAAALGTLFGLLYVGSLIPETESGLRIIVLIAAFAAFYLVLRRAVAKRRDAGLT